MDIHTARQQLKTKSIYDIPMRVTYYARVSSEKDEQLNSLGNQISYYEDFIKKNPNWTYVEGYIDEGLSAATTKKRENFHRMVDDGKAGVFDFIITKEISRFARNTLDSIQFTRELLNAGVGVFFQNDNINTLDEDSELRLTIMSGIAQDELRKLSSRVKFGHAQAIKKNVVLGNSRIFGYVKDGGRLVIDQDEAPMVRELFELYATGQYSMKQIETLFWEKGYRNHNGKKIAHTTMSGMISNPKYKGYYVGNKVKVIDLFTKKQKFLPPEEWVMFKDETGEIVPAIVDEELWEQANKVLKKRSEDVKGRQGICNHANLLTGKLYCTDCGAAYYRRESKDRQGNKNSKWVCSNKIKSGADACASFPIYEEELKPLLFEVFQETEADAEALIEEYIEMYKSLADGGDTAKQIDALRDQADLARKKKSKLLGYNAAGQLSDKDFLAMNKECDKEIEEAERQIYELEQQQLSKEEFRKHIDTIRRVLHDAKRDAAQGIINKDFIDKYIDKIFVTPEADGTMRLQIKIFTGETTNKYLSKLRGRTGHTLKKMMLATAVAYCRDIKTYMVNYGGDAISSDPVKKYTAMKYLYDNGYFARKEEFQTYPMELVRYVMDAKMDDSEILWLREYTESRCADLDDRINGYTFVNYVNTWYDDAEFYDPAYESKWDAKYGFLEYGVSYGVQNLFRLWMMMEKGGICWGISGMGMNTAEVHGIPAVNTYQPGHEAYLIYSQNDNGDGTWTIWNNVGGWGQSYSRWGDTIATEARLLLGWGCMEYITNYNKNNTTYILLAQAALNDYDQYLESMYANFLAQAYPAGTAAHEEALDACLDALSFNLDGMYGLIKSYAADANTTNEEWEALARRVVEEYTYYPAVMVDLLELITPHFTDNLLTVEVNTLETQALHAASQATQAESLQPDACREIANSLLGQGVELATFSFDGEHANSIVLDESYDQYEFMVRYSLDGGTTWETHLVDGQEVPYTPDHIITLTPEQLKRVTAEQDIVVGLVGVDTTYTIDIQPGQAVQSTKVYLNDNEDLFIGATDAMEYSVDGGESWQDYEPGLTSTTRFTGQMEVLVRYKAHGVYLRGPETAYTFHPSTDTPQQTYLRLENVTLVEYSSQQSEGADHAAANFIDGNGNTAWHTQFNATDDGKFYTVKLDQVRYLSKLSYLPGAGQNGRLKSGQIYVSLDGDTWTLAHTFEGLENNTQRKDIVLPAPVEALYVKVVATETYFNYDFEKNLYFSGKMLDFYVDTTQTYAPQAQVTYSTQAPTNQDVTATLDLPQGCTAEVTEYVFEDNSTYTFTYTDANGAQHTAQAAVTWIDRIAPTGQVVYSFEGWTNQPVTATLEQLSEDVTFADGSDGSYVFDTNRDYTFTIRDAAGNETAYTATVAWIDPTKPEDDGVVSVEDGEGETTLTLNIHPDYVEVLAVNGQTAGGNEFLVTENGTYTFQMRLKETGYTFEYAVVVDWLTSTPQEPDQEEPDPNESQKPEEDGETQTQPDQDHGAQSPQDKPQTVPDNGTGSNTDNNTGSNTGSNTGTNTGSNASDSTGGNSTTGSTGNQAGNGAGTGGGTGTDSQTGDPAPSPQAHETPSPDNGEEDTQAQPSASPTQPQEGEQPNAMAPVIGVIVVVLVAALVAAIALWRRRKS